MLSVNTKTQLIAFFLFALLVNIWNLNALLCLMGIQLVFLLILNNSHFFRLMRRLKWFFLVMLLIFVFNTPGEHIAHWSFSLKPTYEGLQMGAEQVLRVAVMLAAISIVLTHNTKQQLISGLYFLLQPLTYFGFDVQRFAARLWLTLHYVDLQQAREEKPRSASNLTQYLNAVFVDETHDDVPIVLDNPKQTWADYAVISTMVLMLILEMAL